MGDLGAEKLHVYVEQGTRRAFAGAVDWPGWCRSGRDEPAALGALLSYGTRYERAIRETGLSVAVPTGPDDCTIVARLPGSSTTDFGAPGAALTADEAPVGDGDLRRLEAILAACWSAFDRAVAGAAGRNLGTGPRGGGRDLAGIVRHQLEADAGYLARIGGKVERRDDASADDVAQLLRRAAMVALAASARGAVAPTGPRGGVRWTPRAFVRRAAWHALDHAWEIEDRVFAS